MRWRGTLVLALLAGMSFPAGAERQATTRAAQSAWIAFTPARGGVMLFDMRLNGQPVRALFDTGATRSIVSTALARRLGLPFGPGQRVSASGGMTTLATVSGIELETGSASASGLTINAGDLAGVNAVAGVPFDLVLGMDVLGRWAVEIDYAQTRFRLTPTGEAPPDAASFPLRFSEDRRVHWVEVRVSGSVPLRLHVDTGYDGHILLAPGAALRVDRSGLNRTTVAAQGLAGLVVHELTVVPGLALGALTLTEVPLEVDAPNGFVASRGVDGLVGMALLRRFHSVIDFPGGRMFLTAHDGPQPPLPRSSAGLQMVRRGDAFEVLHVMANSPAAAAGWRAGDRFCAVDGVPASAIETDPATAGWSRGPAGREVVLTMCDGSRRTLRLARFY